ncbi:MAG TPA: FIST N-terminal domain-containing protein, partial [Anaerolineales bacterium]|nr:FIST N-terminal domain-containing protein [Anaerolineales bacterium]
MSEHDPGSMQFASALSLECDAQAAAADISRQIHAVLGDGAPDLALVFLSNYYVQSARPLIQTLAATLNPGCLLGCTAEAVIGAGQELEDEAGVTVIAARLPGVKMTPFVLHENNWHALLLDEDEFRRRVGVEDSPAVIITLADPFSTPMDDVLHAFNTYFPGVPLAGGMASGALRPNGNTLALDDRLVNAGMVGVALSGSLEVDLVVSQGCRPIWQPFVVQSARKNVIFNLEGQPPLAWIQELIPQMPEDERELLKGGLFVGR